MPPQGGVSGGFMPGWIYEPLNKVQQGWAAVHECDTVASEAKSYWDGGKQNFACFDYKGCSSGRRIMRCFYDGGTEISPREMWQNRSRCGFCCSIDWMKLHKLHKSQISQRFSMVGSIPSRSRLTQRSQSPIHSYEPLFDSHMDRIDVTASPDTTAVIYQSLPVHSSIPCFEPL